MAEDRIKEILSKSFSELTEDLWKELQDLISALVEAEGGEGEGEGEGGAPAEGGEGA